MNDRQEANDRILYLGNKIFTEQSFTMEEVKEYTQLTNDAVLGRGSFRSPDEAGPDDPDEAAPRTLARPDTDRCGTCRRDAHRPGLEGYGYHGQPYRAPSEAQSAPEAGS